MLNEIPCLRCSAPFTRLRRNPSHFCQSCRLARKRIADRERQRNKADQIESMRSRLPKEIAAYVDDYGNSLELFNEKLPVSSDRLPPGSKSPAGPDEGRSTYFTDLAGELNTLCTQAAEHEWWAKNPHWAFDLHGLASV